MVDRFRPFMEDRFRLSWYIVFVFHGRSFLSFGGSFSSFHGKSSTDFSIVFLCSVALSGA